MVYLIHKRIIFRGKSGWAWIEGVVEIVPLLLAGESNFTDMQIKRDSN